MRLGYFSVVLLCLFPLGGYSAPLLPEAELTGFLLKGLSLREATFSVEITIRNPYPVSLPVKGIDVTLLVQEQEVAELTNQGRFSVPAKKTKASQFEVEVPYLELVQALGGLVDTDRIEVTLKGQLDLDLPDLAGLPAKNRYNFSATVALPALDPSLGVADLSLPEPQGDQLGAALLDSAAQINPLDAATALTGLLGGKSKPKGAGKGVAVPEVEVPLSWNLVVVNQASLPLSVTALRYRLYLNGAFVVEGSISEPTPSGARVEIAIISPMKAGKALDSVRKILASREGKYRITGTIDIRFDSEWFPEPFPLPFDESGEFHL